jgi:tetratricopeptide (TPR) repeat protein
LLGDLRKELAAGNVLVVVGTGVSIQASGGDPRAGWDGLILDGIEYCLKRALLDDASGEALRGDLRAGKRLEVAERITAVLDQGDLRRWLEESAGALPLRNPEIIEAIHSIGAPLATTNYDDLLSRGRDARPVSWTDPALALQVVRDGRAGVLHFHGCYDVPSSVILGTRSYQKILEERGAQALQQAVAAMQTLLFIGCGDGLSDPNFGSLLKWSAEAFPGSIYSHYSLCSEGEARPAATRLKFIEYGDRYEDLAPFLRRELAAPRPPSLPPAGLCLGRKDQVRAVASALLKKNLRPVPILGGPGMGKTTIALEVMQSKRVASHFGARRHFVRLDGTKTRAEVAATIALALAIPITPSVEQDVLDALSSAPAALVLDNAETPLGTDPEGVEAFLSTLSAIDSLALVVTIRGLERPHSVAWGPTIEAETLSERVARDVFVEAAGRPAFRSDRFLPRILDAMDGVPLAITLMAHFAETFDSLQPVWERWQQKRTAMLKEGMGKGRLNNIAVSYELSIGALSSAARRLLTVLALLPDGVARVDLTRIFPEPEDAADELQRRALAVDEEGRVRMRAPLREYMVAEHPPDADDEERAVRYYLALGATEGAKVGDAGGSQAVSRLVPEIANIETIIERSPDDEDLFRAVHGWGNFARLTGLGSGSVIEHVKERAQKNGSVRMAAMCAMSLGHIALARSEYERSRASYEEAISLYRKLGNVLGEANCIRSLGDVALNRAERERARASYEEALPLYRQVRDVLGEANCIARLGEIALANSQHERARASYEEALPLYRQLGDVLGEANCISGLGDIALARSEHERARASYEEAMSLFRQAGAVLGEANCIARLGEVALALSEYERAFASYEEALPLYRQLGDVLGEANCILGLGDIDRARGNGADAKSRCRAALALYERIAEPFSIGWTHRRLARLSDGAERTAHIASAREAWIHIGRDDLVKKLDKEFGADS